MMRTLTFALWFIIAGQAAAQDTAPSATIEPPAAEPADLEDAAPETEWAVALSAYYYFVPDDDDFVQPTLSVDYDWLHLEARYNYEDLDTASAWIGCNFSFGEELTLDFTPMFGVVWGDTDGVAPGYELSLGWKSFELYSEGEYVIDSNESDDSFMYTWTELTYSPTEWLRAGLVVQRTRAYETDLDIQRGVLIGVTYEWLDFTAAVFNPDDSDPVVMLGLGVSVEF